MSGNQKKILAQQIKEDLQKDLEEAKKEEKSKNGFGGCSWLKTLGEDCGSYRGNEWRLTYFGSDKDKWKEKQHPGAREGIYVFPEELEPNDWKEIESLIQQIKELEKKKEEKETQKYREEQAKIDQKLNRNPKLFLYEGVWEWAVDYDPRGYDKFHVFSGSENGQKFHLTFRENHPAVVNFSYNHNEKIFFQIEGVENMPFQPEGKNNKGLPWKEANLNDKITITEFKERSEKDQSTKNKPTDNPNSQPKELNDKTLLQYFQKNDIKSIKLENEKLIIERNDNSISTNLLTNFCELKRIDQYLENKNDKTVTRRELELRNNSDTAPSTVKTQDNNSALWIGCGIGGILMITVIFGLLLKRKVKKH